MAKLTAKQTRFISEYCIDCNAARAAVAAGYSEDTAKEMGYENLTKPHIAKLVREKLLEMASRAEITAGAVLRELALLAFADMGQYNTIDEDGNVRMDFREMGPDGMRAVKKIKQEVRYKLQAAKGGGFVFQSDHSVSSNVAPESYELAIQSLRELGNYPLGI